MSLKGYNFRLLAYDFYEDTFCLSVFLPRGVQG